MELCDSPGETLGPKNRCLTNFLTAMVKVSSNLFLQKGTFNDLLSQEAMDTYDVWHSKINGFKQYYQGSLSLPISWFCYSTYLHSSCVYHHMVDPMTTSKPAISSQLNISSNRISLSIHLYILWNSLLSPYPKLVKLKV